MWYFNILKICNTQNLLCWISSAPVCAIYSDICKSCINIWLIDWLIDWDYFFQECSWPTNMRCIVLQTSRLVLNEVFCYSLIMSCKPYKLFYETWSLSDLSWKGSSDIWICCWCEWHMLNSFFLWGLTDWKLLRGIDNLL